MPTQDLPQFTPAQVLDAARRAESESRNDFAVQFYQHLATSFPGTAEAAAANEALHRLLQPQQQFPSQTLSDRDHVNGYPLADPFQITPSDDPFNAARAPYAQSPLSQSPLSHAPIPPGQVPYSSPARAPPPDGAQAHGEIELPEPSRDYRTGRILARIVTWLGGLMILGGVAVGALAIMNPRSAAALPIIGGLAAGPILGAIVALSGLAQIFLGQVVRAILDQANAARDLAELTRAGLEARPPQQRRRARR